MASIKQMSICFRKWREVAGHNSDFGKFLAHVIHNCLDGSTYDLRDVARFWSSYTKSIGEHGPTGRSKNAWKKYNENLGKKLPIDKDLFIQRFRKIRASEPLEDRIVAIIAGIPPSGY